MPNLLTRLFRREPEITRYTVNDYINWLTSGRYGLTQPYGMAVSYSQGKPAERIENSYEGYTYGGFKANPIVFGTMTARSSVFSEARFMWRRIEDGRPGDLFSDDALDVLRRPWPNGTTGELLSRMIQDVDLAGNCYLVNEGDRLRRLRPDWVQIVLTGDPRTDPDVDVFGYVYTPGGPDSGDGRSYMPDEVCHWSPIPDPDALYRGMSWLTPVVREIQGDSAAVDHKIAFFRNGATLGPIVKVPAGMTAAQFKEFVEAANNAHQGVDNAYRPMYVGGGADVTLQAATMQQLDFKALQGASETRICVAARVPAVIAGVSEGLAGSSLNAGNYGTAKRSFADGCLRPMWRSACAALMAILQVPEGAELWYDERDIAFLRDDEQDIAQIQQIQAATISSYYTGGWVPETARDAVVANDLTKLKHTGVPSVQVQEAAAADTDGDGVPDAEAAAGEDYEAALDEFRSELAWRDEILRKFNPDQPRDWRGRWSLTAAVIDALKAQGGEQGHAQFDEDRYVDWSSYDPDTLTYSLEFGDGENAVQFEVNDNDLEQLYNSLTVTRLRDASGSSDEDRPSLAALKAIGHADHLPFDDGGYIDWSTREPNGDYGFGIENADGDTAEFDLSPVEMDQLIASLALSTQARESVRSYVERRDYYDVRDFRGRFRKMSDRVGHALNEWLKGDGDADDPLEEFSRENLRLAAKEFGITPRRGASSDELKLALLKDARARFRGDGNADAKPSHRLTLSSPTYRDQDVGVYHDGGKVSLYRESSSGQRGSKVVTVASLADLEQWGRDNGEPQVAEWAASERGAAKPTKRAPAKKAPAKKAAAPAVSPEQVREIEVENRIAAAVRALKGRPFTPLSNVDLRGSGWILLSDLRKELGDDIPRAEVDAALKRFALRPGNDAVPEPGFLRPEDYAASFRMGGQQKNWLRATDVSDRPLPAAPPAKAAPRKAAKSVPAKATPKPKREPLGGDARPNLRTKAGRQAVIVAAVDAALAGTEGNTSLDFRLGRNNGSNREILLGLRDEAAAGTFDDLDMFRDALGRLAVRLGADVDARPDADESMREHLRNKAAAREALARAEAVLDAARDGRPLPAAAGRESTFNFTANGLSAAARPSAPDVDGVERVEGEIRDGSGAVVGSFRYHLDPSTHTAHMDSVGIAPEHGGKGFTSSFVGHVEDQLKAQGFTHFTVDAAFGGGLFWARRGYDWNADRAMAFGDVPARMAQRLADHPSDPDSRRLREWLDRFDGDRAGWPSPQEIANAGPLGESILDGSSWRGEKRVSMSPAKSTPRPRRQPLGDPAAKLASLRALGDVEAVRDDLDLHTVAELKILAGGVGVATSGRKRDVVDRITAKIGTPDTPAPEPTRPSLFNPWYGPPSTVGMVEYADSNYTAAPDDAVFDSPDSDVRRDIEEAWFALTGGKPGSWASLEDVRTRIGDRYPFKQVNRVLRHLNRERGADLLGQLHQEQLTQRQRDARVNIGGNVYHEVGFDGDQAARIREQFARDRQASLDTARTAAEALVDLDAMAHNGGSEKALRQRVDTRVRMGALTEDEGARLRAAIGGVAFRTTVADILSSRGATTHHTIGDTVPFDPSTMRAQGDRPDRGTLVQVVSPGATLTEPDGTVVTLAPTVVMEIDESRRSLTPTEEDEVSRAGDDEDDELLRAMAVDGDEFEAYWTRGKGLARWSTKPHPWRTLRRLLRKHPGIRDAEGLASHYFHVVFGIWPGERKGDNPVGPG